MHTRFDENTKTRKHTPTFLAVCGVWGGMELVDEVRKTTWRVVNKLSIKESVNHN